METPSTTIRCGAFDLVEPVGEGATGVVYRGRHRETGAEVAVKVIRQSMGAEVRSLFHREVQAHAGLVHPGVVYLFEYGELEEGGWEDDELAAGNPFVAMEMADAGSLRDQVPIVRWRTVKAILAQVLDALAYSHARGVVHRDLKPENFLCFGADSEDVAIKLSDFGLAHALGKESERRDQTLSTPAGTPLYMAPEQIHGRWRRYGPWTDLYALGCITWELVCGRPPFRGETTFMTVTKHEMEKRPPLDAQIPVPDGLEEWIHTAMSVDISGRFRRAADASRALHSLDDPGLVVSTGAVSVSEEASPTLEATRFPTLLPTRQGVPTPQIDGEGAWTTIVDEQFETREEAADMSAALQGGGDAGIFGAPSGREALTLPETWQPGDRKSLPSHMVGTGLGLFGLRETPFVDRVRERDRLWTALREVQRNGEMRVVLVVGESGAGKSRLVEWMATRAHEVGAATILRAVHSSGGDGPSEGVAGMIRRAVRGDKLARGEFYEHLLDWLPGLEEEQGGREVDARALTELVYPTDDDAETVDGPRYRFAKTGQKAAVIARLVRRLGTLRPTFLWLDDIQWGDLALAFLEHLSAEITDPPASLVAVTLRADILAEDPALREQVRELERQQRCARIDLEPLAADDHREFVERLLPLRDDLCRRLADRTEGNPLFATQLLGHLVERGELAGGTDGFRLSGDASLDLPDDIHELWVRRLTRLTGELADDDEEVLWQAVEMAAALGREVDGAEWRGVCDKVGLERPDALQDRLTEQGLVRRTDRGWSFAHGLLVESIERHASEEGRWSEHHRRCVELLGEQYPGRSAETAARRAEHWIEAGDLERAVDPLIEEIERLTRAADVEHSRRVTRRCESLLDQIGASEDDPRRIEVDIRACRFDLIAGESPEAVLDRLEEACERAKSIDDDRLRARSWILIAHCHQGRGAQSEASESASQAVAFARRLEDETELAAKLVQAAWVEYWRGEHEEADRQFAEAYEKAVESGNRYWQLDALRGRAWVAVSSGDENLGRRLFQECRREGREAGFRLIESECFNGLGELARFGGDADRARERYRSCGELARELNLRELAHVTTLNLAQVELMAGRFDVAADEIRKAEEGFERLDRKDERIHLFRFARLNLAAGAGDWEEFERILDVYDDGWPSDARLQKDLPWLLEMAGDYAADDDRLRQASHAWEFSRFLWAELDDDAAADRVAKKAERRTRSMDGGASGGGPTTAVSGDTIRCGSFELVEPVGEGAMARVWRARHARQDIAVAVKTVSKNHLGGVDSVQRFRAEAEAQAGLHHPGIVEVFDVGVITEEEASRSEGELVSGSAYLAMEYAPGGTLADTGLPASWAEVRDVLLVVLDALAHSHARDVVHRDLKPENVLSFPDAPRAGRYKLSDFGLAHALAPMRPGGTREVALAAAGTPHYMAPEQCRGEWRRFGPWTDLYALGCIAFQLVSGQPPYAGPTAQAAVMGHIHEPIPALRPRFPIPGDLEGWIRAMLAKSPAERYRRAADAAMGLERLADTLEPASTLEDDEATDGEPGTTETRQTEPESFVSTIHLERGPKGGPTPTPAESVEPAEDSGPGGPAGDRRHPLPDDWDVALPAHRDVSIADVGIGLLGVREIPFVDRDFQRDRIWRVLRAVTEGGETRGVVVRGDSGTGKSRLVRWVARRAHEVGACSVLKAPHDRRGGPGTGLVGMVERWARAWGLERGEVHEVLLRALREISPELDDVERDFLESDAAALTELIAPSDGIGPDEAQGPMFEFHSRTERLGVVVRLVRRLARRRPVFLWLDDVQWGEESLEFARMLLESSTDMRVLVAMTVRGDLLDSSPLVDELIGGLADRRGVQPIDLGPLREQDHVELVGNLLSLDPELTETVAMRTEGNPMYAVQLVRDWAQRELLVAGETGFQLAEAPNRSLPDDVHQLWMERLRRALRELPDGERNGGMMALEIAAALGRRIDVIEWPSACRTAGIEAPAGFLERELVSRGLVQRGPGGFAFVHAMLVESLERVARDEGRWRSHHRACAEMLEAEYRKSDGDAAERQADHWVEAGELERALDPLFRAARRSRSGISFSHREALLKRRAELMDELELPGDDRRRVENDSERALNLLEQGRIEEAAPFLESACKHAERYGWDRLHGHALLSKGWFLQAKGDEEGSAEAVEQAEEAFARVGDRHGKARCLHARARTSRLYDGDMETCRQLYREARELFEDEGDPFRALECDIELVWADLIEERFDAAEAKAREALEASAQRRDRYHEARSLNIIGVITKESGDLADALDYHQRAYDCWSACGSRDRHIARLNAAMTYLRMDEFDDAQQIYEWLVPRLTDAGLERSLAVVHIGLSVCKASREAWDEWDGHVDEALEVLEASGARNTGQAEDAERSGDIAAESGEVRRAERAYEMSAEIWEAIGHSEDVARVREKLAEISD